MRLPFLWGALASPSCLAALLGATASRSRPITLLSPLLIQRPLITTCAGISPKSPRRSGSVDKLRGNQWKNGAVRRSGATFLNQSAPCCHSFSFFFSPSSLVAIAGLWAMCTICGSRDQPKTSPAPEAFRQTSYKPSEKCHLTHRLAHF